MVLHTHRSYQLFFYPTFAQPLCTSYLGYFFRHPIYHSNSFIATIQIKITRTAFQSLPCFALGKKRLHPICWEHFWVMPFCEIAYGVCALQTFHLLPFFFFFSRCSSPILSSIIWLWFIVNICCCWALHSYSSHQSTNPGVCLLARVAQLFYVICVNRVVCHRYLPILTPFSIKFTSFVYSLFATSTKFSKFFFQFFFFVHQK